MLKRELKINIILKDFLGNTPTLFHELLIVELSRTVSVQFCCRSHAILLDLAFLQPANQRFIHSIILFIQSQFVRMSVRPSVRLSVGQSVIDIFEFFNTWQII